MLVQLFVRTPISKTRKVKLQLQRAKADSDRKLREKRQSFLMSLLYNQSLTGVGTAEQFGQTYVYRVEPDALFEMGCVHVDGLNNLNYSQQTLLQGQLLRKFSGRVKERMIDVETYPRGGGFIFLCILRPEEKGLLSGFLANLQILLSEEMQNYGKDLLLSISLGNIVDSSAHLRQSLESALQTLNARIILGNNEVLRASEIQKKSQAEPYVLAESVLSGLFTDIELGETATVRRDLRDIFVKAGEFVRKQPAYIYEVFEALGSEILAALHQRNRIGGMISNLYLEYREQLRLRVTLNDMISFSADYIADLLPVQEAADVQEDRLAQNAKKYINEHLKEDLKLEDVAAQFYLSASYFGVLIKEKIGETFTSYVATARINKAKDLLQNTMMTVDEIAGECGYQDRRYFSKLFKKTVGVTPKEYRKVYQ